MLANLIGFTIQFTKMPVFTTTSIETAQQSLARHKYDTPPNSHPGRYLIRTRTDPPYGVAVLNNGQSSQTRLSIFHRPRDDPKVKEEKTKLIKLLDQDKTWTPDRCPLVI